MVRESERLSVLWGLMPLGRRGDCAAGSDLGSPDRHSSADTTRLLAIITALALFGCSGGGGDSTGLGGVGPTGTDDAAFVDPYGGAMGCSDGGVQLAPQPCQIRMPLSGGLSGVIATDGGLVGCGTAGSMLFTVDGVGPGPWSDVHIQFTGPLVAGQVGTVGSVAVRVGAEESDGGEIGWMGGPTCTLVLASNVCLSPQGQPGSYAISGTGSCPDPLPFVASSRGVPPAGPLVIGDFDFTLLIGAPPSPGASDQ